MLKTKFESILKMIDTTDWGAKPFGEVSRLGKEGKLIVRRKYRTKGRGKGRKYNRLHSVSFFFPLFSNRKEL